MADKNTPIPFTVGDREDIVEMKTILKGVAKTLDPTIPTRVTSLETTRTRQVRAIIAMVVAVVGGLTLWGLKALLMASTGIPVP